MDLPTELPTDVHGEILSHMNEKEKLEYSVIINGGGEAYNKYKKNEEYWIEKLSPNISPEIIPNQYLDNPAILEKFYLIVTLLKQTIVPTEVLNTMLYELDVLVRIISNVEDKNRCFNKFFVQALTKNYVIAMYTASHNLFCHSLEIITDKNSAIFSITEDVAQKFVFEIISLCYSENNIPRLLVSLETFNKYLDEDKMVKYLIYHIPYLEYEKKDTDKAINLIKKLKKINAIYQDKYERFEIKFPFRITKEMYNDKNALLHRDFVSDEFAREVVANPINKNNKVMSMTELLAPYGKKEGCELYFHNLLFVIVNLSNKSYSKFDKILKNTIKQHRRDVLFKMLDEFLSSNYRRHPLEEQLKQLPSYVEWKEKH